MPDGRGILLPCKAKKRRQYFVYCKIFQRGRPAKDPLRRCRMVVNTGSKVLLNFFQKIAGSRGSETASVWFQTKLTGAKRLPRGFSANAEARHTPRRPCGLSCGLGVSDPSPQAPPRQARRISYFLNFFQKIAGPRGRAPDALRTASRSEAFRAQPAEGGLLERDERGTLYPVKRIFQVNCREAARGGFLQEKKPPCRRHRTD